MNLNNETMELIKVPEEKGIYSVEYRGEYLFMELKATSSNLFSVSEYRSNKVFYTGSEDQCKRAMLRQPIYNRIKASMDHFDKHYSVGLVCDPDISIRQQV